MRNEGQARAHIMLVGGFFEGENKEGQRARMKEMVHPYVHVTSVELVNSMFARRVPRTFVTQGQ